MRILLILVFFVLPVICLAQEDLDFKIPAPPESELTEAKTIEFGGRPIQIFFYKSQESEAAIRKYYESFFQDFKFKKVTDGKIPGEEKQKRLCFKKTELVVNITLTEKPDQVEVVIAKHLDPLGAPPLEKLKPSVKDSMFALPTEDRPGKDLDIIPRPPDSIRLSMVASVGRVALSYATSLSVEDLKDFYQEKMPYQGWENSGEDSLNDVLEGYQQAGGGKNIEFKSPFSDGEDLNAMFNQACRMMFKGRFGMAKIIIMPNFMDKKLGSMVQIEYQEPK